MLEGTDLNSVLRNTLHGDGTTKYHLHFQNFQVTTSKGQSLSAGLLEVVGQDAQTLFEVWQKRFREIAQAMSGTDTRNNLTDNVNKLVASVKNTMSDQCATNGVFNSLIHDLRAMVFPDGIKNWDNFSDSEKTSFNQMGNFVCKVHPLVTFVGECSKSLIKFENAVLEGKSKYALSSGGESGSVRLSWTSLFSISQAR